MRYKIHKNILWKLVDGELVIVRTDTDEYLYLNSTGADIFEMMSRGFEENKMLEELVGLYDAPEQMIGSDMSGIISELKSHGIIEEVL